MAWNDPGPAAYRGQSGSQAPVGSSSGFENLQRQISWNSIPMVDASTNEKSRTAMAGPSSQNAFISSIPVVSEISSCGALVTTSWASDGTLLTQITPRLGSDSTSQEMSPESVPDSGKGSNKINQRRPSSEVNDTVESIQQDALSAPLMEGGPSKTTDSLARGGIGDESNQMMLDTNLTSGQTSWLGDNESIVPDEDFSSQATKSQEDRNDPKNNSNSGSSKTQVQPKQAHRARNRKAATKCRAKAKAAKAELEDTEREMEEKHQELSAQASSLQNEVLTLKNELLMHGNCDCEVIQQYLSNAAQNIINHDGGVNY